MAIFSVENMSPDPKVCCIRHDRFGLNDDVVSLTKSNSNGSRVIWFDRDKVGANYGELVVFNAKKECGIVCHIDDSKEVPRVLLEGEVKRLVMLCHRNAR